MFGMFKAITPAVVRKKELLEAELNLIEYARKAEHATAMAKMLRERVLVLRNEVAVDDAAWKAQTAELAAEAAAFVIAPAAVERRGVSRFVPGFF